MSIPTLQEEVDRKAFESISSVITMLESGLIAPAQCDLFLNILQIAFSGIVSDGDICDILTDASKSLKTFIPLKQTLKVSLIKDGDQPYTFLIQDCSVVVSRDTSRTRKIFDTPAECLGFVRNAAHALISKGYKFKR